jgi:uncharacterized membrane protein YedE/YeeE
VTRARVLELASAFAAGLVFALGLGVAGMTRPSKVIAFLDPSGRWDPSLALVMGAAVAVTLGSFVLVLRRASPVLASRFLLPAARGLDARLFFGSAVFGAGWGLSGICPGPAVVSLVTAAWPLALFAAAMAAGMLAAERLVPLAFSPREEAPATGRTATEATVDPTTSLPLPVTGDTTCG